MLRMRGFYWLPLVATTAVVAVSPSPPAHQGQPAEQKVAAYWGTHPADAEVAVG